MSTIDIVVAVLLGPGTVGAVLALGATLWMIRVIPVLANVPLSDERRSVSIISPACNEAASLGASVQSWLDQDGVDLQIVVIDDRSTDGTGALVDELARDQPPVTAVHISQLPDAWLGKLNALHQGVQHATGEWMLFADADVRLTKGALARAIHHAEIHGFDLVTAYPEIESADFLADLTWAAIGATAGLAGLWRSRDPSSERAFGMGAFVLVRREAFEQTPGFPWLKLEVADDMGLAILLKHHGHRCDVVCGRGQVRLQWYTSFRDMVQRSQKNWFAILSRFSLARAVLLSSMCLAVVAMPLALLLPLQHPAVMALPIVAMASLSGASTLEAIWSRRPILPALFAPLGLPLLAGMVLRAAVIGQRMGGIAWRGVVYPSTLLRGEQRFKM